MVHPLVDIITASDPQVRDTALESACAGMTADQLVEACDALDAFRRQCDNLYERVRALFFLYAIYRFHLPNQLADTTPGRVPFEGYEHLLIRRFEEAIDAFLAARGREGVNDALCSALSSAYKQLAFQTLANQVRRSVRSVRGNQWMFRIGHPADHPLRVRDELLVKSPKTGLYPMICESTPVRMDLSHSAWSDIFFLGMDYPQGARVLNVSVDLGVRGRDASPKPPIEAYFRVIDQPVLRLVSVDLNARADINNLTEVFDFARDYLGLLKAAVIAAGIVPAGVEGSEQSLSDLLERLLGPGRGIELVSSVNNIPKGSRLAVSTNLLASLIAACMRATGQAESLTGPLNENERRIAAARAILGEWIGGSGGGWQDSGGIWPGMKLICGAEAGEDDPEHGISRGRLLPNHRILDENDCSQGTREKLQDSLVLVHGGLAQNVGPILEMVTEKYLLRSGPEWAARKDAMNVLDNIVDSLKVGDIAAVGRETTRNFFEPLQAIIPWASTYYTELLIDKVKERFGDQFWGFWMLGGMSGGGMGFIFEPSIKTEAQDFIQQTMSDAKAALQQAMPYAMEPVVYDFAINPNGTTAIVQRDKQAVLPGGYYRIMAPTWLRTDPKALHAADRAQLQQFSDACQSDPNMASTMQLVLQSLLPQPSQNGDEHRDLSSLLGTIGFDRPSHEQIRADLIAGRIGLSQNRLAPSTTIEDVKASDVVDLTQPDKLAAVAEVGRQALADGQVGVVTLAAGVGSRWTQGAGVVKALNPFARLGTKIRSFIEVHLAKSRKAGQVAGAMPVHAFTTSYLTHDAIDKFVEHHDRYGYDGPLYLSQGKSVGLRLVPMERDLRFAWEEMPQQMLDEQAQKMRESLNAALINWAKQVGEGSDYTDNLPSQCLHPVGHWYEVPNLLRNGILRNMIEERPSLRHLMLHNIDTLGANLDPVMLGQHINSGNCLSFEVITRRIEDMGGGLARINGQPRLVEGLAMPREEDEFKLSYYNTMTTWIDIDQLLAVFKLTRDDLADQAKVDTAVRKMASRMPTYVTIKDVKKRWGHGQEDIFPVAQFEKLWSDMTTLPEVNCGFFVVPRIRGQQLKDQAQLDGWLRDGSAAYVEQLCAWD